MNPWRTDGENRYQSDDTFRQLVDMMYAHIMANQYTPGEMREAAMTASLMVERLNPNPRPIFIDKETADRLIKLTAELKL